MSLLLLAATVAVVVSVVVFVVVIAINIHLQIYLFLVQSTTQSQVSVDNIRLVRSLMPEQNLLNNVIDFVCGRLSDLRYTLFI